MPALMTGRSTDRTGVVVTPSVVPTLHALPSEIPQQHIVAVTFRADDHRRWYAVGGGATVAAAIAWAREACPDDGVWEVDTWHDLYGD